MSHVNFIHSPRGKARNMVEKVRSTINTNITWDVIFKAVLIPCIAWLMLQTYQTAGNRYTSSMALEHQKELSITLTTFERRIDVVEQNVSAAAYVGTALAKNQETLDDIQRRLTGLEANVQRNMELLKEQNQHNGIR